MLSSAILIGLGGCASTTRFVVERAVSTPLRGERRPAVAISGPPGRPEAGEALTRAVIERLKLEGLDPVAAGGPADPAPGSKTGDAPREARNGVFGVIDSLDVDAGLLSARLHVVGSDGVTALAPIEHVAAPAPLEDLVAAVAARIVAALVPATQTTSSTVEWEDAGEWDVAARAHLAQGRVEAALAALEEALRRAKAAAVDAGTLAALHYDLGLCLDVLGRWADAERALDEALTLRASELHIEALQDLRRRRGAGVGP